MATKRHKPQKPQGYTINALADLTGIDRRTWRNRLSHVKPVGVSGPGKLYSADDAFKAIRNIRAQPQPVDPGNADLERVKLEKQIERMTIEIEQSKEKLIDAETAKQDCARYAAAHRTRLLSLGMKLSTALAICNDPITVQERIDSEVREILTALAQKEWTCAKCGQQI